MRTNMRTFHPHFAGVAPSTVIPGGKAIESAKRPALGQRNQEGQRQSTAVVNGHRKLQGFGHRKWQGRPADLRRERSDRSGAAGRQRGRHDIASVAAGDPPSIRFARVGIGLESSSCRRMR